MQEHLISYVILHLRLCSSLILYQSAWLSINSVWAWGGCAGRGVAKFGSEARLERGQAKDESKIDDGTDYQAETKGALGRRRGETLWLRPASHLPTNCPGNQPHVE